MYVCETCCTKPFIDISQIGYQHGRMAHQEIRRCIDFYKAFLQQKAKKSWSEAAIIAPTMVPCLTEEWPAYMDEMKGVAAGSGVGFISILLLNVRTEVAFGLMSDGCTTFSVKNDQGNFLA